MSASMSTRRLMSAYVIARGRRPGDDGDLALPDGGERLREDLARGCLVESREVDVADVDTGGDRAGDGVAPNRPRW